VPELPDIEVYAESIAERTVGKPIVRARLASPFLVRSFDPPLRAVEGKKVARVWRMAKRIVLSLEDDLHLVIHLMVAGRFRWKEAGAKIPGKLGLLALDFDSGTLLLTEAGTKRRASLYVVRGEAGVRALDPGGIDPLRSDLAAFKGALVGENHTLKRSLTDPHLFSGIGNAYSDELLHRAKLSPVRLTKQLGDEEIARLYDATRSTLTEWTARLRDEAKKGFPENVTAFREDFAVHGRYGKPCPVCGSPVQRIRYAENEANYCAKCQTGGKLLADRGLSRLLRGDWPKSLEEMEERKKGLA
jgi:formamidopyrimidine-DNA glycosylase